MRKLENISKLNYYPNKENLLLVGSAGSGKTKYIQEFIEKNGDKYNYFVWHQEYHQGEYKHLSQYISSIKSGLSAVKGIIEDFKKFTEDSTKTSILIIDEPTFLYSDFDDKLNLKEEVYKLLKFTKEHSSSVVFTSQHSSFLHPQFRNQGKEVLLIHGPNEFLFQYID